MYPWLLQFKLLFLESGSLCHIQCTLLCGHPFRASASWLWLVKCVRKSTVSGWPGFWVMEKVAESCIHMGLQRKWIMNWSDNSAARTNSTIYGHACSSPWWHRANISTPFTKAVQAFSVSGTRGQVDALHCFDVSPYHDFCFSGAGYWGSVDASYQWCYQVLQRITEWLGWKRP